MQRRLPDPDHLLCVPGPPACLSCPRQDTGITDWSGVAAVLCGQKVGAMGPWGGEGSGREGPAAAASPAQALGAGRRAQKPLLPSHP